MTALRCAVLSVLLLHAGGCVTTTYTMVAPGTCRKQYSGTAAKHKPRATHLPHYRPKIARR